MEFLTITEAAKFLNVSIQSLRIWDNEGKLKASKTPGGHRRYNKKELEIFFKK